MKFQAILVSSMSLLLQGASAFQSNPNVVAQLSRTPPSFSARHNEWRLAAANENEGGNPFGFIQGLFQPSPSAVEEPAKPEIPDVVVDSDYKLAAAFGALGIAIILSSHGKYDSFFVLPLILYWLLLYHSLHCFYNKISYPFIYFSRSIR